MWCGVFGGNFPNPPDLVAFPKDESEIETVLAWCEAAGAAVVPFGGGTSVVGGVEARLGDRPVVSMDLRHLDRVLEVDPDSLAARIQGGATGPVLEEQLREHGLTLRHFPQSFEYATLGGWVATRAGGHFATLYTHIDDLVESVRAITPRGTWESRRLPGSGRARGRTGCWPAQRGSSGWSPRPGCGSGHGRVQALLRGRVRRLPRCRGGGASDLSVRSVPANCRLLDATEAGITGAGSGERNLLVLGFESPHHPVEAWMDLALEMAREHGGAPGEVRGGGEGSDAVGAWRNAFLLAPYLRDTFVACGVLSETFETAVTWDRFEDFHAGAMAAVRAKVAEVCDAPREGPGAPRVSCRFTHVYPDGPAPYFTVLAPAVRGGEVEQWDEIKAAAAEALIEGGGTITHHHAVGRDHRPWSTANAHLLSPPPCEQPSASWTRAECSTQASS